MNRIVTPQPTGDPPVKVSTRRSLVFSALGAIVGLGIAGYGLFTAKGTETSTVPAEDVALVNSKPVLLVDFVSQLQSLYSVTPELATKEQKEKLLSDMIREELFVQRGLEVDEPSVDPDVRAALVNAVDQQAAADSLSTEPSDDQLRKFYTDHQAKYSSEGMVLLHDLVPADPAKAGTAQAAVQALRSGTSVAEAMARFGLQESGKVNGEEFYFAAKIHLGDILFAAAAMLNNGQVSEPVIANGIVHILVMDKNILPVALEFDKARTEVLSDYQQDASKRIQAGEEGFLRKRADIQIAPEFQ